MTTVKILTGVFLISAVVYSQNFCFTPNGEQAQCIPLQRCPILFDAIYDRNPQTRQFLRQSQCSLHRIPFVCCGSVAGYARLPNQYQIFQEVRTHSPFVRLPSGRNIEQPFGQNIGQSFGQNIGQPPSQNIGQPSSQNFGRPPNQNFGQPPGQNIGLPLSQNIGQPPSQNFRRPSDQNSGQTSSQNIRKPSSQNIRKPSSQNIKQSTRKTSDPKTHRNIKQLPKPGECGVQSLQDKIVGGTAAGLDEFPWLALLNYRKDGQDVGFHCGGMLINERYVLTAAHCITGTIRRYYGDAYQVRLGEYDTRTDQDCTEDEGCNDPPQDATIEEAIFHTGYNENTSSKNHDIALLRLRNPITFSYFIQPICLPLNGERTSPGKNMSIAGWGRTEFANRSPVKLKASVPLISQTQCNSAYSILTVNDNQLCAGGQKGVDSCNGDSGGPIMNLLSDRETWYAEGIVSFGPSTCGTENLPGVYTRIYGYLNWILDNMKP